jgi:glycosyltransferase involved in cell wall biosynthesis
MIDALVDQGFEVFVFGQRDEHYKRYDSGKARLVEINMARRYTAFFSDILDVAKLTYYVLRYRPAGVHSFNPKPALLSWASVILRPKSKFFIGVTGLGNTFIRAKRMEPMITTLLSKACKRASFVFFQNRDDIAMFEERNIVGEEKRKMFVGPGVDLRHFRPDPETTTGDPPDDDSQDEIVVSCTARLIWQKGISEYVEAAKLVKAHYDGKRKVTFRLIGEIDLQHPDCIDEDFLESAKADGIIEHISWTDDIVAVLNKTDVFVLHSYREGAPRAILEASSLCIPTIGADAIGVRELVVDGVTGYLTPLKEVRPIADAIIDLVENPRRRREMGFAARRMIAEPYSLTKSSDAQLDMYRAVGYDIPCLEPDPLETMPTGGEGK